MVDSNYRTSTNKENTPKKKLPTAFQHIFQNCCFQYETTAVIHAFDQDVKGCVTLVDLPGIYYGDKEMTALIKDIYREYIKNPNCIILYINSCKSDWNISEALAKAREVDPG
jgi:hypothetical protein